MRNTVRHTETAAGRDAGKVFVITEMGARPGHRWACRVLFAMMNAGVDMPDGYAELGMAALATMAGSSIGRIPFEVAEPMLDELLTCVRFIPDPANSPNVERALFESDIEEVATIFKLQHAAFKLHLEPFTKGVKSISELTPAPTTAG